MVNQKEQVKNTVKSAAEQILNPDTAAPEQVVDPLAELLGRAQSAYAAYIDAQKEVAKAFPEYEYEKAIENACNWSGDLGIYLFQKK